MGILTDIFIATEDEVAAATFAEGGPADVFPTLRTKGIDAVALASLSAILDGADAGSLDSQTFDIAGETNIVRDLRAESGGAEYESFIIRLSVVLVSQLGALAPTAVSHYGAAWAETFWRRAPEEPTPVFIEGIITYHARLCQLARQARDEQKMLYLWICV